MFLSSLTISDCSGMKFSYPKMVSDLKKMRFWLFYLGGASASAEKILEFEGAKSSFQKGLCGVEDYVALNFILNLQILNMVFGYNLIIYN